MATMKLPKTVTIGEVVVRDGFQREEQFIPTEAKLFLINALVEAGFKHLEISSFAHPSYLPQFKDVEVVLKGIPRKPGVEYTCITTTKRAVERAVQAKKEGFGPDRVLLAISTSEVHNRANLGLSHAETWRMQEECLKIAHDAGVKVNGCVSTIWGCPFTGETPREMAYQFVDRFLQLGADDIEHADHDGQATPDDVYRYFSNTLDRHPDPNLHVFHVHDVRGFGLANYFAAMQAGVTRFETAMGGLGGQPANIVDRVPVRGTGDYYVTASRTGLVSTEDFLTMLDGMGIETGINLDKVLRLSTIVQKVVGRRLWSFCAEAGKVPRGRKEPMLGGSQ